VFTLVALGEPQRARRLLERSAGVDDAGYTDVHRLRAALGTLTLPLSACRARELITVWAGVLRIAAMSREADWVEDLYTPAGNGAGNFPAPFPPEPWVVCVVAALDSSGWALTSHIHSLARHPKPGSAPRVHRRLTEMFGRDLDPVLDLYSRKFRARTGPALQTNSDVALPAELQELGKHAFYLLSTGEHDSTSVRVCESVVEGLRKVLNRPDLPREERLRRAEQAAGLRRLVVAATTYWAAQTNDELLRKQAALWDAEIGRRVLLERLLGGQTFAADDKAAAAPAARWPFADKERPVWSGGRPNRSAGILPRAAVAVTDAEVVPAHPIRESLINLHLPAWLPKAQKIVDGGVDEGRLAQEFGAGTVLLRGAFDLIGRLVWTAFLSDGRRLTTLAHNGPGGDPTDRERLVWAAAHHDLRLALAYLDSDQSAAVGRAFSGDAGDLPDRLRQDSGRPDVLAEGIALRIDDLYERLGAITGPSELRLVGDCVDLAYRAALRPPDDVGELPGWAERSASQWERVIGYVRGETQSAPFLSRLNRATEAYLGEIAAIWSLDRLADVLSRDHDVVVQVEDALHTVPVAHLPVGEGRLWQRVRSVRASLSVLADIVHREAAREADAGTSCAPSLLVISAVAGQDDRVRQGTIDLHHGHANLAARHGIAFYAAAERPPGEIETLFKGLAQRAYCAVTVYGHGDVRRGALLMTGRSGPALWRGQGSDLSGVEFLLLPSCSIGRTRGSAARDVEGFCVELAVHGARSVLSCRWPVQCQLAADVTNEVLHQYLLLRAGQVGPDDGRCRALALNQARKEMFSNDGDKVYLSTLAAFELYGMG